MDPIRTARQAKSGNQAGDPDKAAQALLQGVEAESSPIRLFLGEDALGPVQDKLTRMKAELAAWDCLSRSTSYATRLSDRTIEISRPDVGTPDRNCVL